MTERCAHHATNPRNHLQAYKDIKNTNAQQKVSANEQNLTFWFSRTKPVSKNKAKNIQRKQITLL